MPTSLILRTHGGLGNQLFQVFYAFCYCRTFEIGKLKIIHDSNYSHGFELAPIFKRHTGGVRVIERLISRVRLPKILHSSKVLETESIRIGGCLYLDGYFQDEKAYCIFSQDVMASSLRALIVDSCIDLGSALSKGNLYHVRLGDFYANEDLEFDAAVGLVKSFRGTGDIITNNQTVLQKALDSAEFSSQIYNVIDTANFDAFDVLQLMTNYKKVYSNNSTLAFWASVISGGVLLTTDDNLNAMRSKFFIHDE
jgi:hypothetical protein